MHVSPSTALRPSMLMHSITGGNCGPDLGCSTHVSRPIAPCAERVDSLATLSVPGAAVPSQSAPASYLSERYVAAGCLSRLKCYHSCTTTLTSSACPQTGVRHYAFRPNSCTNAWLCWTWSSENTRLPCCLGSACFAFATTGTLTLITRADSFADNYPAC